MPIRPFSPPGARTSGTVKTVAGWSLPSSIRRTRPGRSVKSTDLPPPPGRKAKPQGTWRPSAMVSTLYLVLDSTLGGSRGYFDLISASAGCFGGWAVAGTGGASAAERARIATACFMTGGYRVPAGPDTDSRVRSGHEPRPFRETGAGVREQQRDRAGQRGGAGGTGGIGDAGGAGRGKAEGSLGQAAARGAGARHAGGRFLPGRRIAEDRRGRGRPEAPLADPREQHRRPAAGAGGRRHGRAAAGRVRVDAGLGPSAGAGAGARNEAGPLRTDRQH